MMRSRKIGGLNVEKHTGSNKEFQFTTEHELCIIILLRNKEFSRDHIYLNATTFGVASTKETIRGEDLWRPLSTKQLPLSTTILLYSNTK
jgi:hypothetical protein